MSRIGKQPVAIPKGVEVKVARQSVEVKGKGATLSLEVHPDMSVKLDDGALKVTRPSDQPKHRALHGLTRALLQNMVDGVTKGFEKQLEIVGVGYNAKAQGNQLVMNIGFCHPVEIDVPKGLTVETPRPTRIVVKGADKRQVGQFAANIRQVRPPEPYKGKGIRYVGEQVRRKAGKAFGSA